MAAAANARHPASPRARHPVRSATRAVNRFRNKKTGRYGTAAEQEILLKLFSADKEFCERDSF